MTSTRQRQTSQSPISPYDVLKRHFTQLCGVITVPDKLANDLSMSDLISGPVATKVLTTPNLDQYQKASMLVNEIHKSLRVFNDPETLVNLCAVLKRQGDPDLVRIAESMLEELSINVNTDHKIQPSYDTDDKEDTEQASRPMQPTSTMLTRRALKNPKQIKNEKDVLRNYHSDISSTLNVCAETLKSFTGMLFQRKIIDRQTRISVDRQGGLAGAGVPLDHIDMKVDQRPKLLYVVLEEMASEENLRHIVKKIKGESDSEDEEIVPSDTRTTPTDCRNDNGKNEHDKGGHFSVKSANGHIVDKGSKSTYTCFWMSILGGSLLIVFIAISFGSYVPGLNEVPPVTHVSNSEASSGMSNAKSSVLPSSTEIKGKKEETTSFTQDSIKDLKDEPSVTGYYGNKNKDSYPAPTTQMDGGLIPKDENLLINLRTVSEVTLFCSHLGLPDEDCDTIKTEHPNDLGNQKFSLIKKWRQKKKRTWKEFIIPFALLDKCAKAKELATEYSVYFDAKLKDDQIVLDRCTDINNRDKTT